MIFCIDHSIDEMTFSCCLDLQAQRSSVRAALRTINGATRTKHCSAFPSRSPLGPLVLVWPFRYSILPFSMNQLRHLIVKQAPDLSLGEADQSVGLVCGNGWSQDCFFWSFGMLSGAISKKISQSFEWESYSAGQISPPYQEPRVETRNWKHARINKTDQTNQPINQSTSCAQSSPKNTVKPVVDWLIFIFSIANYYSIPTFFSWNLHPCVFVSRTYE